MGNPNTIWGYLDRLFEDEAAQSSGSSHTYLYTDVVPAGVVWVIERWTLIQNGGQACAVSLKLDDGSTQQTIYVNPGLASNTYISESARLVLKEGDRCMYTITGLPDTTVAFLWVWGYKMTVP